MDLSVLGAVAILIPFTAAIVKQSVDIMRGAFNLDVGPRVVLCYALSLVIMGIMVAITAPSLSYIVFLQAIVAGILAANQAASLTDTHERARDSSDVQDEPVTESRVIPNK